MSPRHRDFWLPSVQKAEDALRANGTFQLLERTSDMHVIHCRYVFRTKKDVGPKVRIVANAFRQVPGVKSQDSHAPVISLFTVRLFVSIVHARNLDCDRMDVVTAFLNGDL